MRREKNLWEELSHWYREYIASNWIAKVSALLIVVIISGIYFFPSGTQGATYTFNQTSWSGGSTANTAVHPTNETGWNQYASATGVTAGADVKLPAASRSFTDDGVGARNDYAVGNNPKGVAFDSSSNSIWVANGGSNNVTKLDASTGASVGNYTVGTSPVDVTFDSSTNSIWTTNNSSNNVTKLNASSGALIGTYNVGSGPYGVAFDPSTDSIWVANGGSNNVTKLDASTGAPIGTYAVGAGPAGIRYDSSTNSIWVANQGSNNVTKLSSVDGSLVGTYAVGSAPTGITFDPSTNSIWVANYSSANVTKLNASTGASIGTYSIAANPTYIAFDPTTNSIWTMSSNSNEAIKLSASTGAVIGTYTAGNTPWGIIFDPSTNSVWVTNYSSNNVSKIIVSSGFENGTNSNTTVSGSGAGASVGLTGAVIQKDTRTDYSTGSFPGYAAFDSSTNSIWVTNETSNNVTKLNASTGATTGTYAVGINPQNITFDSFTNSIWVVNNDTQNITKLNASTGALIGTYTAGTSPRGIAFDSSTNSIWVANFSSNNVTKLNSSTGALIGTYPAGTAPWSIAFDPSTNSIWVTNNGTSDVTKLNAETGAVVGTYTAAVSQHIIFESATNSIWVAGSSGTVHKINPSTGAVIGTYATGGSSLYGITFDSSTGMMWVSGATGSVIKFRADNGSVLASYTVGSNLGDLAFDPSTNSIWVPIGGSNTIAKLSAGGATVSTYTAGTSPYDAAFDSSTNSVWVPNAGNNNVTKINASTGATIGTYAVGSVPKGVTFDSSTNSVWVANSSSNNVTKLNVSNGAVIGTYAVGTNPTDIAFDPSTNSIWTANSGSQNVTKLNASDGSLVGTYAVANQFPVGIAFDSSTNSIWVSHTNTTKVTKINASTGATINTYTVTYNPQGILFDPSTNSIWVAHAQNAVVDKLNASTGALIGTYTTGGMNGYPYSLAFDSSSNSIWEVDQASHAFKINASTGALVATYTVGAISVGIAFDSFTNSVWAIAQSVITKINVSGMVYSTPGTFTSAVIDLGAAAAPSTLAYSKTTPANTTLTMDIRAGNTASPDGSWTSWTTDVASGGSIASLSGNRYFQYRANLSTTDTAVTATLNDVTLNYSQYGTSGSLTSSTYDASSPANVLGKVLWTASGTSGTETVQFQVRSSSDGNTWSSWCGYEDCSGTSYFDTAENGVDLSGSHPLQTGSDDRYFQYKIFFTSAGAATPTLSSATVQYVVNAAPDFDTSFGTNGITVSQVSDSSDPNWGKVKIDYRVRDIDTSTGTVTPNNITPSFQYDTGGGFTAITSGYLSAGATTNKTVEQVNYTTYTAYWDAQSQIPGVFTSSLSVKVTVDDNEGANHTAAATDTSLTLDTKNPVPGEIIDASSIPAVLTLSATDDNAIERKVSLNADMSGASFEAYSTTKNVTLATDPDTVYVQFRDAFGNLTAIQSVTTPETPIRMMIQDTSNVFSPPASAEYRLFIAWGTVVPASPAFASYKIYRSPDNSTYTLLDTINSRTTNYYADNSVVFDTLYYYKVETVDASGNVSYRSVAVSGKANGAQDAGEGGGGSETTAPSISTVASSNLSTTEATITWETDELSTSTVGFSTTPSTFTNEIGVEGYTDNAAGSGVHRVVLSGLSPNTPYYYRILSSDPMHNQGIANNGGGGYTFTTLSGPAISGVALSSAANTQATITWNTDIAATSTIEYATSVVGGALSSPVEAGSSTPVTSHSVLLTPLVQGTTYYFSVKSQSGSDIAEDTNAGSFYEFTTTTDTNGPVISTLGASVIAFDRAALTWATDEQATSQIRYATVSGGPYTQTTETVTYGQDHYVILNSLAADTTYYFKAFSSDLSSNPTLSPQNSFTTLQDPSYQHDPLTSITSVSASLVTDTNAVISLTTDQPAMCTIEYGTQPGSYTATPVTETLENKNHAITLPSLLFSTVYYYKATCIDNLDTPVEADEKSFTTLAEQVDTGSEAGDTTAPGISSVSVGTIAGESAIITWKTDEDANGYVRYGITTSYGDMAGEDLVNAAISTYAPDHTVTLKNLVPSTKYYYVVLSSDASGNLTISSESSFTTKSPSTISSINILSTKIGEATLTWKTSSAMTSIVEYGLTEIYGNRQESTTFTQDHSLTVGKLVSNQLYHFRVKGKDKTGNLYSSSDYTFEPKSPPQIKNITSKVLSDNEAEIDFTTSIPTDALVVYVNTKDEKDTGSQGKPELTSTHSLTLKNLQAGATYSGKIVARDEAGNEVTEVMQGFTTSEDTDAPLIDQLKTDMALSQDGKVQAIISWYTDEPATTAIAYKEGTAGEEKNLDIKEDLSISHIAVLTTFKVGSVYFLKARSVDKSGNETVSKERMILTPQRSENVVQVIITNFKEIFSWAKL